VGLRIPSLPAGTYEMVLVARGLQPWKHEITVEAGKTARVLANPLAADALRLRVDAAQLESIEKSNPGVLFEDASGGRVSMYLPGGSALLLFIDDLGEPVLMIHNLHANVAQVRLVADGYEDVV